jgi:hypothetical protein
VVSRTFPDLSGRVTAVGTGVLLDVQRSLSCSKHVSNCFSSLHPYLILWDSSTSILEEKCVLTASSAKRVRLVVTLTKAGGTLRYKVVSFLYPSQKHRLRAERNDKAGYSDVLILNQDLFGEE